MSTLPPIKRIVTGHDSKGKAILITEDERPALKAGITVPLNGGAAQCVYVHESWITPTVPYDNAEQGDLAHELSQGESFTSLAQKEGAVFRAVDFPPMSKGTMHRTQSIDFGIMHEGEVYLELDEGVERVMKRGDVVVQRGTIHAWNNKSPHWSRMYFILIGAKDLVIDGVKIGKSGYEKNN